MGKAPEQLSIDDLPKDSYTEDEFDEITNDIGSFDNDVDFDAEAFSEEDY